MALLSFYPFRQMFDANKSVFQMLLDPALAAWIVGQHTRHTFEHHPSDAEPHLVVASLA